MGTPTRVAVRVIAKGGKYLGDDIGGALVTVEDVQTGELLARGTTGGGSGIQTLTDVCVTRLEVLTVEDASVFIATLDVDGPRLIRVTAYGPLAARQSANTVSLTQWVYPGKDVGGETSGGLLLEIPGLVVQVLNPPTHFMPATFPHEIEIRANVTMMCGCPIGTNTAWNPDEFDVTALIEGGENYSAVRQLAFDEHAQYKAPSQFRHRWRPPKNEAGQSQIYEITVSAFQRENGNTGVDRATLIIPAASATHDSQG
jgi:hypothetical protein